MNKRTCTALASSLVATLALGAAGCSGDTYSTDGRGRGKNPVLANQGAVIGGTPVKGGTLTVLSNQDFTHLDPARNWVMGDMDFGTRLLYRTLVTYQAEPGAAGGRLAPDLAEDLGISSNGARTWTFRLKKGLKYEDGSPITAHDIKYNVERSFSPDLPGGPDYAARYLAGAEGYQGPAQGKHLDSVKVPDDHTITFELRKPFAEFPYATDLRPGPEGTGQGPPVRQPPLLLGPVQDRDVRQGQAAGAGPQSSLGPGIRHRAQGVPGQDRRDDGSEGQPDRRPPHRLLRRRRLRRSLGEAAPGEHRQGAHRDRRQ
jgi:peptide/nickel transport system substrate-binding protein